VPTGTAKFYIALHLYEQADGTVSAFFEYASALLDRETVDRWAGCYRWLLAAVAADPGRPVDRLPLLPDEERARVLALGTGPVVAVPPSAVHELVAARATERPAALAVSHHGRR